MKIISAKGNELSVQLDGEHFARVHVTRKLLRHSGCLHVSATAYQVDQHGILCVDADGVPIQSSFGHTLSAGDSTHPDQVNAAVRSVVAVVVGEEPEIESWRDDIHREAHMQANLRTHLSAQTHAQAALAEIFHAPTGATP